MIQHRLAQSEESRQASSWPSGIHRKQLNHELPSCTLQMGEPGNCSTAAKSTPTLREQDDHYRSTPRNQLDGKCTDFGYPAQGHRCVRNGKRDTIIAVRQA